jgi:hypothetical protein
MWSCLVGKPQVIDSTLDLVQIDAHKKPSAFLLLALVSSRVSLLVVW